MSHNPGAPDRFDSASSRKRSGRPKTAAILLAAVSWLGACSPPPESFTLAESIGRSLIDRGAEGTTSELAGSRDFPGVVYVGSDLADKLDELRPVLDEQCVAEVHAGDAPDPIGDRRGTHHVYLVCDGTTVLGMRLRYESQARAFHVLGFWTP